jgi:hypothetical protein
MARRIVARASGPKRRGAAAGPDRREPRGCF